MKNNPKQKTAMNRPTSKPIQQGFTLIELMMVIGIIGIIVAVASSSYSSSVIAAKRTDARKALQETATTLEKCKATYGVYNSGCSVGAASIVSPEGLYSIAFTTLTASQFTLTATPATGSSQSADTDCTSLTLTNLGQQGGGGDAPSVCW